MAENKGKKAVTLYNRTVKYLSQVKYIDEMISEKQDILDSLRSSITGISASTENERVQTSPKDRLGETCAKIADLCEQQNRNIDSLVEMKAEIIQTIDQYVDDLKQRRLLYLRYLKFMPMLTAAREMHIAKRTAYRLHDEAVNKISAKFKNGTQGPKMAHTDT